MTPAALKAALDGDMTNFVAASTPGGIERQEAEGQKRLAKAADRLPVNGTIETPGFARDAKRSDWEAVGFVFGERLSGPDKIFVACTFPKGWGIAPSDHSMWSDVVDDKSRKRARVFFKAAFYDYNAHTFGLVPRYRTSAAYLDHSASTDYRQRHFVLDEGSGNEVYQAKDEADARAWLDANLPDHRSPLAYWDAE